MDNLRKKAKRKKAHGFIHDVGKFLIDIAKLGFGSIVLGSVIRWDIPQLTLFYAGIIFTIGMAVFGILLSRLFEEE